MKWTALIAREKFKREEITKWKRIHGLSRSCNMSGQVGKY
jgi:hypothetical protein